MLVKFKRPFFVAGNLYPAHVPVEVPDDTTLPKDAEKDPPLKVEKSKVEAKAK